MSTTNAAREIQSMRFFVIRLLLLDDGYAYYLSSDGISGATPPMLGLGDKGKAYLAQSLHLLDQSLDNKLHVIVGDPLTVLKDLSKKHNATSVHISASYEPNDSNEDQKIESAGVKLVRTGSPYAVAPGRVRKPSDDTPYRVYTPFYKAWSLHGWRKPAGKPKSINAVKPGNDARAFPDWKVPNGVKITPAGEAINGYPNSIKDKAL